MNENNDRKRKFSVNLNKGSQTDSGNESFPMTPTPDNQTKYSAKDFGCGCVTIIIIIAIIASMANCLGCGGKSDKSSDPSSQTRSSLSGDRDTTISRSEYQSDSGNVPENTVYNEYDVRDAANALFNAIRNKDTSTGSKYVIDSERLQDLSRFYARDIPGISDSNIYSELFKLVSAFRFYPGTPLIDKENGTAIIDVTFEVPDGDECIAITKLCLNDILTNSNDILTADQSVEYYINAIGYITSKYGVSSLENYSQDAVIEMLTDAMIYCCNEGGLFDNIPYVTKVHTLEFTYLNGGWKLSGVDDLASLSMTLMGDMDPSIYGD